MKLMPDIWASARDRCDAWKSDGKTCCDCDPVLDPGFFTNLLAFSVPGHMLMLGYVYTHQL